MGKWMSFASGIVLLGGMLAGCAQQTSHIHAATAKASGAPAIPASPAPGKVVLNWGALPPLDRVEQVLGQQPAPRGYRTITAEQVQCRAAECAVLGNLLAAEQELVCCAHRDRQGGVTPGGALLSNLLAARAVYERNDAAGKALELFHRLAEAELQRGVLRGGLQEIDQALADYRQLQQKGIVLADDDSALRRQRFEVLAKQVELETRSRQAEGQLGRLMAIPRDPHVLLSPVADLTLSVAPVDVDSAVSEGLALRADLCMLRMLCQCLNQETLEAVRSGMQQVGGPMSGSTPPAVGRLLKKIDESQIACEQHARRTQCRLALADQTRAAEEEIRNAAREVEARLRQAALAKQKWASWLQRVADLREKRQAGQDVPPSAITEAQLKAIESEGDAIAAAAAWKVATVKLKQARGLLSHECGFQLPPGCIGSCAPLPASSGVNQPTAAAPLPAGHGPATRPDGERVTIPEPVE